MLVNSALIAKQVLTLPKTFSKPFKFDYSIAIDGQFTLLRMQISKFEKGICLKVANNNFATFLFSVIRFKEICQVKLNQKVLKKLIELFCHEYELNADRKTCLSLFNHSY